MLYTAPDGLSEFISPDWKQHLKKIRNKRRRRKKKRDEESRESCPPGKPNRNVCALRDRAEFLRPSSSSSSPFSSSSCCIGHFPPI
jgi:hypothetical protein